MLRPRIIPSLLLQRGALVKTARFTSPKYVGDPLNAVRIFNEKEVDELAVYDIDASVAQRPPDFELVSQLASECRMPLCYGGGVKTVEQVERLIELGVEKVAVSTAAVERPEVVRQMSDAVGGQSIVVVLDVRGGEGGPYTVWTHNGAIPTAYDPVALARQMQELGAGEVVINSIDRDGTMKGYDIELITAVRAAITLPITALGGAGSIEDLRRLINAFGVIGAAAGSLFVFKGSYRAVLINYPPPEVKDGLK